MMPLYGLCMVCVWSVYVCEGKDWTVLGLLWSREVVFISSSLVGGICQFWCDNKEQTTQQILNTHTICVCIQMVMCANAYLYLHEKVPEVLLEGRDIVVEMKQSPHKHLYLSTDIYMYIPHMILYSTLIMEYPWEQSKSIPSCLNSTCCSTRYSQTCRNFALHCNWALILVRSKAGKKEE